MAGRWAGVCGGHVDDLRPVHAWRTRLRLATRRRMQDQQRLTTVNQMMHRDFYGEGLCRRAVQLRAPLTDD